MSRRIVAPRPDDDPVVDVVTMVAYRECQRNHAAHLGLHVVDGCGEFMALGPVGTNQELICAACGCHRRYHRRVVWEEYEFA